MRFFRFAITQEHDGQHSVEQWPSGEACLIAETLQAAAEMIYRDHVAGTDLDAASATIHIFPMNEKTFPAAQFAPAAEPEAD